MRYHSTLGAVPCATAAIANLLFLATANAAFINGVETFDGTTLDTSTWEQRYNMSSGGIFQNNVLILDASDGTYERGYCTKSLQVDVGGSVRADVTYNQLVLGNGTTDEFGLWLGTKTSIFVNVEDSALIGVVNFSSGNFIYANVSHNGMGVFPPISLNHAAQPIGTTYIYEIDRLSSTSARFEFVDDQSQVSSQIVTFSDVPDNLYIE